MRNETDNEMDEMGESLLHAGGAVARLPRIPAPADLAARTLARIAASAPVKKSLWFLRPITNPFARCAAAAGIMLAVFPMTDLDMAEKIGPRIEDRVMGRQVVDRVETIVDGLLPMDFQSYSQSELDALINVRGAGSIVKKPRNPKAPAHSRV